MKDVEGMENQRRLTACSAGNLCCATPGDAEEGKAGDNAFAFLCDGGVLVENSEEEA